jgi:hypothetical protein
MSSGAASAKPVVPAIAASVVTRRARQMNRNCLDELVLGMILFPTYCRNRESVIFILLCTLSARLRSNRNRDYSAAD